jgi:predicted RNA binding protein YcfA (HicA-like mRNA interferase family)
MDSRAIIRELESSGWKHVRTKGSHHIYQHPERDGIAVVPHPKRDLPIGTVKALERATGIKLLKRE